MDLSHDQPRQIVCLEHEHTRLYAEVIQVVESRQVCWVRPVLLVQFEADHESATKLLLHDLRSGADLLWSLTMFRPALDTEVMPLLLQLWASATQPDCNPASQQQLNQFIRQVWQARSAQVVD